MTPKGTEHSPNKTSFLGDQRVYPNVLPNYHSHSYHTTTIHYRGWVAQYPRRKTIAMCEQRSTSASLCRNKAKLEASLPSAPALRARERMSSWEPEVNTEGRGSWRNWRKVSRGEREGCESGGFLRRGGITFITFGVGQNVGPRPEMGSKRKVATGNRSPFRCL